MSNQTLLAQGWACGRWTRFCCSWQTRNLGMQKSSFICSTCETKKPMETRETQAPAPELLGELEKIKQAALDKANGKDTHVFICFYVWISYDMFLLHFFMLHVHQHTCTVVWEPYDVARITHTHTCLQDLLVRREEHLRLQKKAKGNGPEDVNVSTSACSSDDRSTRKTEGETPTENVEKAS